MKALSTILLSTSLLAACAVEEQDPEDVEAWESELSQFARSIQNVHTGKCLDIPWGSLTPGAAVNQFTCHGGPAQQFVVDPVAGIPGFVRLRNVRSGLCATPTGYQGWSTPRMPLVQAACNSGVANWTRENVQQLAGGLRTSYRWTYDSAYCIDVPGGSSQDSLQLQAYPCHGGPNQRFDERP